MVECCGHTATRSAGHTRAAIALAAVSVAFAKGTAPAQRRLEQHIAAPPPRRRREGPAHRRLGMTRPRPPRAKPPWSSFASTSPWSASCLFLLALPHLTSPRPQPPMRPPMEMPALRMSSKRPQHISTWRVVLRCPLYWPVGVARCGTACVELFGHTATRSAANVWTCLEPANRKPHAQGGSHLMISHGMSGGPGDSGGTAAPPGLANVPER